ncbi:serine/arginine repetitive matrix protein 1-like [Pectinophora gossypiella]|uniref:serine/arginine repetitive matrix protein 1-like n=1 Tax=Pectinophora gossypiella TaxID=13191 RepID=UPI00214F4191|nr:serine/arginine repetitive matrix protein 1-like [Pectinophora gossypiella]
MGVNLAGAGPSRAGPTKNSANANGSASPHIHRENDKTLDNNEARSSEPKSPITVAHNISINVTDTDSPAGVRRRIHLRSLSDVTPTSRAPTPRARSHSERPAPSPAPSPGPSPAHAALAAPRAVCSARTSPAASRERLDDVAADRVRRADRLRGDAVSVLGDPWRKMSDLDLRGGRPRRDTRDDPWVKKPAARTAADTTRERAPSREDVARANADPDPKRDGTFRRGKLERKAAVVCESCGNESCECWRPRSPGGPRTPRAARSLTAGASVAGAAPRCTCEARSPRPSACEARSPRPSPSEARSPRPSPCEARSPRPSPCEARSPRPSPARLAPRQPVRALSDDEGRPRRLYKSASQKIICTSMENESVKKAADPLLETTC